MTISRDEVRHLALLSRLRFTDEELDRFTTHLDEILGYVQKLDELDTQAVPPTSHVIDLMDVMREGDEVAPSLPVEEALANAADTSGNFFRVPRVTE